MSNATYAFVADIGTQNPERIEPILVNFIGVDGILRTDYGFRVRSTIEGPNARELNRKLLSLLRRVEQNARLEAEWTHNGTTERFVDYEPSGCRLAVKGVWHSRR